MRGANTRLMKFIQSVSSQSFFRQDVPAFEAANQYLSDPQNNYNFYQLLQIIASGVTDDQRLILTKAWLRKEGNNLDSDRLAQVQSMMKLDLFKGLLAIDVLQYPNNFSYEILQQNLKFIDNKSLKANAIFSWIRYSSQNISFDILQRDLLKDEEIGNRKSGIIQDWLRKSDENNFDFPTLQETVLPLVAADEPDKKDDMLLEWLTKEDNNFDFEFLENNFSEDGARRKDNKFQAIKVWLEKPQNNCSLQYLETSLSLVDASKGNADSDRSGLIKIWMEKPENNFDFKFFKKALPLIGRYKFDIFRRWNENSKNIIPTKSIAEILSEFEDPHHKYFFAKAALEKNNDQINYEIFTAIIPLAEDEIERTALTKTCLERLEYNFDIEFLQKAILPLIADVPSRLLAIKTFFEIPDNFDSRSTQDVKSLKEIIAKESSDNASTIIKNCLKSGHKCDLAFLTDVMESSGIKASNNQHNRSALVKYWFKNTAISYDLDYIKSEIIPLVGDDGNKCEIIKSSIEKFDENFALQSSEGLRIAKDLSSLFEDDYYKYEVIANCVRKSRGKIDFGFLKAEILPTIGVSQMQSGVIMAWLKNPESEVDFIFPEGLEFFRELVSSSPSDVARAEIIKTYIENPQNICDLEFLESEILPLIQEDDRERLKFSIVDAWIANPNQNFDLATPKGLEDFKAAFSLIDDAHLKSSLATTYLKKEVVVEKRFLAFSDLASKDFFHTVYDATEIRRRYAEIDLPKEKIAILCKNLYPNNELYQVELFAKFISSGAFASEDKNLIKEFVKELQDDKGALKIINISRDIIRNDYDILDIASNRLSANYQSIREFLQKPLIDVLNEEGEVLKEGSLTEEGIKTVKDLFGDAVLTERNLADLFSYYDINGGLNIFKALLKPQALAGMKDDYVPTKDHPYISGVEYQKLKTLFFPNFSAEEIISEENSQRLDAEIKMPKVELLSQYLDLRTEKIPPMTVEEINSYQINFPKPPSLPEEIQAPRGISELSEIQSEIFRKILSDQTKLSVEDKESAKKRFESANIVDRQNQIRGIFSGFLDKEKDLLKSKKRYLEKSGLDEERKLVLEAEKAKQEERCKIIEGGRDESERVFDEMRWAEVPRIFKEILQKENSLVRDEGGSLVAATQDEVAFFFSLALNLESEINADNKNKLVSFFQRNNQNLAYYFKREGALEEYTAVMRGLGDGCVANIATQTQFALTKFLIKDPCDQKLYSVFSDKIFNPIINSVVDDNLGGSADGAGIFSVRLVNESRISPNGLFKKLQEEFCKDGEPVKSSNGWDFVVTQAGKEDQEKLLKALVDLGVAEPEEILVNKIIYDQYSQFLMEAISDEDRDAEVLSNDVARVAAHIILSKSLPEILDRKYLRDAQVLKKAGDINSELVMAKTYEASKEVTVESRIKEYHDKVEEIRKKWAKKKEVKTDLEIPRTSLGEIEGEASQLKQKASFEKGGVTP